MKVPFEDNTFLGAIKYYQNEIDKDDAIIINGGTNDFYYNQPLDDFKNAVEETIRYCLENFTNPLIICTPIKNDLPDNSGNTLKDYVDIIFELKEKYDFCIIDLYNNINFGSRFNAKRKAEYIPDGIHPSNLGHTFIGSYINSKLNEFLPQIP